MCKNEINGVDQGRNDDGPGRLRPCGLIGFRRLDFFGYFLCQDKK
jgi:hypothetical protein